MPKAPTGEDNDPIVEYEDEFGRVRTGRRSEIPRHLLQEEKEEEGVAVGVALTRAVAGARVAAVAVAAEAVTVIEEDELSICFIRAAFSASNSRLALSRSVTLSRRTKGAVLLS